MSELFERRPQMQLEGQDGNIFAIMAQASMLLNKAGRRDDISEMFQRRAVRQLRCCTAYRQRICADGAVRPHFAA